MEETMDLLELIQLYVILNVDNWKTLTLLIYEFFVSLVNVLSVVYFWNHIELN